MRPNNLQPKTSNLKPASYGPVAAIAVTLLAYFGSQLFGGLLVGSIAGLLGYDEIGIRNVFEDSTYWQFLLILVIEIFSLLVLWWFISARRISLKSIGLSRWPKPSDLGYSLITFGIYFAILIAVVALVSAVAPGIDLEQEQQLGFDKAQQGYALALVFAGLVVMPAIVEEIMIRGFLYTGLRTKLPYLQASISASLLFGAAHLQLGSGAPPLWVAAIDTFVLSMVLIELRERTGALWSGMMVHALKNGLAFVALFVLAAL